MTLQEVSEFDTLDEYKADVKANIKEQKAEQTENEKKKMQAVAKAVENAQWRFLTAMIKTQTTRWLNFAQKMQSQGMTMEQYFQFTG